jgi:hypothetical protein
MRRLLLLLLLLVPVAAAAQSTDATASFDVSELTASLQLAFELEISDQGARVLSSSVLWGSSRAQYNLTDLLVVVHDPQAKDLEAKVRELQIPDPRLVFDTSYVRKKRGRVTIFVPFSRTVEELEIAPLSEVESEDEARAAMVTEAPPFKREGKTATVRIDVKEAVREACQKSDGVCE